MIAEFEAKLANLHQMIDWIRMQIDTSLFTSAEFRKIEIALEEALVNIIRYAYTDKEGNVLISIDCTHKMIQIKIEDFGIPFNPTEKRRPIDRDLPLEERKEGGLGISFMHEFMDEVIYKREDNKNLLILKKAIPDR